MKGVSLGWFFGRGRVLEGFWKGVGRGLEGGLEGGGGGLEGFGRVLGGALGLWLMCERDLWREGGWVFVFGGGGECGFRWVRCGCWCYDYLVDRSYCVLGLYPFSWQDTRFRGLPRPSEDKRDTSNSARLLLALV